MSPPSTTPSTTPGLQRAPLDVYKKINIVRNSGDSVVYEDSNGNEQRISDLGNAALAVAPSSQRKTKLDIPVPTIKVVESYQKDVPADIGVPRSYVRYKRCTVEEIENTIEYNLDEEDEEWLMNHPHFGTNVSMEIIGRASIDPPQKRAKTTTTDGINTQRLTADEIISQTSIDIKGYVNVGGFNAMDSKYAQQKRRPTLPLTTFEHMLDLLENATEFETIITLSQAERLILGKIPDLLQIFGSSSSSRPIKGEKRRKKKPVTVRTVINDVYNYWMQKRSKLKKPLLRKYWPVTASNDTNPHMVFRPREKEKYKLRKKRQNDLDAFRKMKQLRTDFRKVRVLLELVRRREALNKCTLDVQSDCFEQRIYDLIDTSGLPRESDRIGHEEINKLLNVPKYFETQNVEKGKKKKRKRSSLSKDSNLSSNSTLAGSANGDIMTSDVASETSPTAQHQVVASQENPPLFLHPLKSRESQITSWDNAVPFVTSYVDSHPTPTFRFRHRPRIGRGGRVVIDRLPCPSNPDHPPINVFTTGDSLPRIGDDQSSSNGLLSLLPAPLDRGRLSRRIEEISAEALSEDEEMGNSIMTGNAVNVDEENDGDEVLVRMSDYLETDIQLWGEERFAIGPI